MNEQARKIREGDARTLARVATGIENRDAQALETLRELEAFAGHARILGITGPPGAGKSTLVDALAVELRKRGKTLAILAVDPSSRNSGGAILGDRIRMQQHHADPGIFIRSMATRGTLGGMARATADLARLMDAAGKDYVIIETVGVGQDEIEITSVAQVTVVVLVPGMGDDVQALKAGIMEIADIFVINKSDHPGAERVEMELHAEGFTCPVIRTVASEGKGIADLAEAVAITSGRPRRTAPTRASIDHLGIAVQSLEDSIGFYESLGLAVTHRESVATEKVNVAMLPVGESRIELLQATSPDSPIARFLEKRGPGLHHVALRVPDLNAAVAGLKAKGARLLNEPRAGAGGHIYVFVHPASTGGVLLELIQESTN
ncbi:MAG TPA: methylmalonyl Co-A mutase-associated GTPase MeaB [Candidatus Solibacter sp.]|jgi:LAO/AO transport system kinase